ncbi:putative peptidyl-glycine alpha-amidating monooxygenase T19B4.1, partial [Tetrabaena socialis]
GRNAPDLRLPEGVGFSVGQNTGIKYIVAQVHYLTARPEDDHSGVTLLLKPHAVPYAAGLVSFASWFSIPPLTKSHLIKNSCCFKSYQPLTMFAVRVHTHALGRNVYMTRETWNKT